MWIRVIACPANSMYGPNATSLVFRSAISLNWHSFELFMHTVCQRRSASAWPKKLSAVQMFLRPWSKISMKLLKVWALLGDASQIAHIVGGEKYQKIAKLFGRRVVTRRRQYHVGGACSSRRHRSWSATIMLTLFLTNWFLNRDQKYYCETWGYRRF